MKSDKKTPRWVQRLESMTPPPPDKNWEAMQAGIFEKINTQEPAPIAISRYSRWLMAVGVLLLFACVGYVMYSTVRPRDQSFTKEDEREIIFAKCDALATPTSGIKLDTGDLALKSATGKFQAQNVALPTGPVESGNTVVNKESGHSGIVQASSKPSDKIQKIARTPPAREVDPVNTPLPDQTNKETFTAVKHPESDQPNDLVPVQPIVSSGSTALLLLPNQEIQMVMTNQKRDDLPALPSIQNGPFSATSGINLAAYTGIVLENNGEIGQRALGGVVAGINGFHRLTPRWEIGAGLSIEQVYHQLDYSTVLRTYDTTLVNVPIYADPVTGELTFDFATTPARDIYTIRHYNERDRIALSLLTRYRLLDGRFSAAVYGGPHLNLEVAARGREVNNEGGVIPLSTLSGLGVALSGGIEVDYSLGNWRLRAGVGGRRILGADRQAWIATLGAVRRF